MSSVALQKRVRQKRWKKQVAAESYLTDWFASSQTGEPLFLLVRDALPTQKEREQWGALGYQVRAFPKQFWKLIWEPTPFGGITPMYWNKLGKQSVCISLLPNPGETWGKGEEHRQALQAQLLKEKEIFPFQGEQATTFQELAKGIWYPWEESEWFASKNPMQPIRDRMVAPVTPLVRTLTFPLHSILAGLEQRKGQLQEERKG